MATAKKKPATVKPRARSAVAKPAPAKKPAASKAKAKPETPAKGKRPDYEAMARDYRTGTFTDEELGIKYGRSRQAVTKMAKVKGWQKDLSKAVRQATSAALIAEAAKEKVAEQVAEGSAATLDAVLISAETNKQVILGHRKDIAAAQQLCSAMFNELSQVTVNPRKLQDLLEVLTGGDDMTEAQIADARLALSDLTKLPTRSLAFQRLSQSMVRLQAMQRVAFGLDDPEQPPPVDEAADLSDEELDARINERLNRIQSRRQG